MADMTSFKTGVTLTATLTLDEEEVAALDALAGYGTDVFLNVFYHRMGRNYLEPHADGLRKLFAAVRKSAGPALSSVREARKILSDAKEKDA